MGRSKNPILACWYDMPNRKELMDPFIEFSKEREVILLCTFQKQENYIPDDKLKRVYWYDFTSPQQIIREINPSAIIFAGLEALYTIALNFYARKNNIPTFELQHGTRNEKNFHIIDNTKANHKVNKLPHYRFIISFYLNRVKWSKPFLLLLIDTMRIGVIKAVRKHIFEDRLPAYYLCYTRKNSLYYHLRDGRQDEKVIVIGNPLLDSLFNFLSTEKKNPLLHSYFLLIDTCLVESQKIISNKKLEFYKSLNDIAQSKGHKVVVKLHPHLYDMPNLPNLESTIFIKNISLATVAAYINSAKAIISFYSSLLMPIIAVGKRVVVLKVRNEVPLDWKENGLVENVLDLTEISSNALSPQKGAVNESYFKKFIEDFCYKTDGLSTQRLITAVINKIEE